MSLTTLQCMPSPPFLFLQKKIALTPSSDSPEILYQLIWGQNPLSQLKKKSGITLYSYNLKRAQILSNRKTHWGTLLVSLCAGEKLQNPLSEQRSKDTPLLRHMGNLSTLVNKTHWYRGSYSCNLASAFLNNQTVRLGEGVHTEAPPSPQSEPLPPFLRWLPGRLMLSPHPFTALARTLCWHLLWKYFCSQRQRGRLLWKVSHRYGLVAAVTNMYQQRALFLTCGFGPLERNVPLVSARAASPAWVRGWWFLAGRWLIFIYVGLRML